MFKFIFPITLLFLTACNSAVLPNPTLIGATFPSVNGTSLEGQDVEIPKDFSGAPALLLIGYAQRAQFDIDRWILGALQAELKVKLVEIPTIKGMVPEMIQSYIDNGMRSGIPKEDWGSVITVYEDAGKIISLLGNERPQSAYVVLIDSDSKIVWTSNRGYSATQILELKNQYLSLP